MFCEDGSEQDPGTMFPNSEGLGANFPEQDFRGGVGLIGVSYLCMSQWYVAAAPVCWIAEHSSEEADNVEVYSVKSELSHIRFELYSTVTGSVRW